MFSASKPQKTIKHPGKKREMESEIQEVYFDVNAFIGHVFNYVNSIKFTRDLWQYNIDATTEIATLIAESAARLGVKDNQKVSKLLCDLILTDGSNALHPRYVYSGYNSQEEQAEIYMVRIQTILNTLQECDLDAVLDGFFYEEDQAILFRMTNLLKNVVEEEFTLEYLPDWFAIYRFLLNTEKVEMYFDQLEDGLQEFCSRFPKGMKPPTREDGKYILPTSKFNPYNRYKILSDYLYDWAQDNGFKQKAKLIGSLSEEGFFRLLSSKTFFKDCASDIGSDHGAWSHALQWYCIIEHQRRTGFLNHHPLALYQQLGDKSQMYAVNTNLWNILFDKYDPTRYHSPECVTDAMASSYKNRSWPILAESVNRLQKKMRTSDSNGGKYSSNLFDKHAGEQQGGIVIRAYKKPKQ